MASGLKSKEGRKREYRQKGYWGDATLADYWRMAVLSAPEKTAVADLQGACYTYADLDDAAGRVAAFLKAAGISPGELVAIQLPNWAEFTVIYVACLKVGAVVTPVLSCYRADELAYILNKSEAKIFFHPAEFRGFDYLPMVQSLGRQIPSLRQTVTVEKGNKAGGDNTLAGIISGHYPLANYCNGSADDLAAVLFTSGTSGFPKGVMFSHNNIIASEKAFAAAFNFNYLDVMLMPAPVAHATGFHHGVNAPMMFGGKSVLQDRFTAGACLELIARERCTCGMGATPFVHDIIRTLEQKEYDISSLRFFLCGGAPVPGQLVKESLAAGLKVLSVYGSTESVPHTAVGLYDSVEKVFSTDGTPVPGVEIRVVDRDRHSVPAGTEGEEASRGPNVFMGYLKEPGLTEQALDDEGWYYSGDLCIMDSDGYIRITGRIKDVIIRGGENISSVEIENILLQLPNVRGASVVAMPDPRLGERICAYVVLKELSLGLTLNEVKNFFALKSVAKCKYPERIEIIDSFPQTASGKIKKFVLRQDIMRKLNNEGRGAANH